MTAFSTGAQTWQTADDFQYTLGLSSSGSDIGTDSQGNLYAVGGASLAANDANHVALVNVSHDHGASWTTLEGAAEPGWTWEHFRAFASTGNRLFIGGNGTHGGLIRESVDGGLTWTTTDRPDAGISDVAINPVTGDVYAGGSSGAVGGIIRKRAASATGFTTVYATGSGDIGSAWSIAFHPSNGSVIVAGNKVNAATGATSWITLRSATGDTNTWQLVDTFTVNEWTGYSAGGCWVTSSGTIYVSGSAYNSRKHKFYWIVRASADGGNTWTLSDNFSYGGYSVEVFEMTQDTAGNLYVCGQAEGANGLFWIVRKGTPGTTWVKQGKNLVPVATVTWTTGDVYQLAPGKAALPLGITVDASGNLFVCGRAQDAAGIEHFIVRKLSAQ